MSFKDSLDVKVQAFYEPITGMRKTSGEFGIEIEVEGDGLHPEIACKGWRPHQDNSLRGRNGIGHGGMEFVTHGAIPYEEVNKAVTSLRVVLAKHNVTFREDSPRTSTHIHHNVQDLSWGDVFGYITVFAAIEPLFLHLCGPRRDGNSFCTPSFDTGDLPEWFRDCFSQLERYAPGAYVELPGRGKYASLGTFRLHDLGTLECRCFPYSVDPDTITRWCSWLRNIKNIVTAQEDKSFRGIIKQGIHDPMVLATSIFGDLPVSPYLAAELIQFGSREAYELTRVFKHYFNKKPDEKKARSKKPAPDGLAVGPAPDGWLNSAEPPVARPFAEVTLDTLRRRGLIG